MFQINFQKTEDKRMKKDTIFAVALLVVGVLLFLFRATGITVHIVISVLGILVLAVYTVMTKKDWKIPALEILMRVCYGVAIITGGAIMKLSGISAIAGVHRLSAVLFVALLILLLVQKARVNKG
jgi:hypothetical protein